MSLSFDPLSPACKSIRGAVPKGKPVTFRVFGDEPSLTFVINRDGEEPLRFPMKKEEGFFTLTLRFLDTGLHFYYFETQNGAFFSSDQLLKGCYSDSPFSWELTVFEEDFTVPEWVKGGTIYQIFPDRFYRAEGEYPLKEGRRPKQWGELPDPPCIELPCHDFFGGNLKGITQKLDYLASLGITVIYLNPIFQASSNHRYDTGDFLKIDPLLGDFQDFETLVHEADRRGIKILLDGVFNHTGADSVYFNRYGNYPSVGAFQSKRSKYFKWYHFHPHPDNYDCWWGIKSLPAVNEMEESYLKFLFSENGVIDFWLKKGIGGFRLDVADELPDEFLQILRKTVKENDPNALIVGEVWEDASDKISYGVRRKYLQGKELDSVMDYPLKNAVIDFVSTGDPENFRKTIAMLLDHYPKQSLDCMMNLLGTHDTPRILSVLENAETRNRFSARDLLKRAALLEFTLPGVPCIFYGDENATLGGKDPDCRRCFDWEHQDADLQKFYKTLARLRMENKEIFSDGIYREIYADAGFLIYERSSMHGSAYVYVNFSQESYVTHSISGYDYLNGSEFQNSYIFRPNSYGVLITNAG